MILGFDHLAFTVTHLDQELAQLGQAGWQTQFVARQVVNPPQKKPLLHHYLPFHDLVWCASPLVGGAALELVRHGESMAPSPSPYHLEEDGSITLSVADTGQEMIFWQKALGFHSLAENSLILKRPLPQWSCRITLQEEKNTPLSYLDSPGYPCVALLCSDVIKDTKHILKEGGWQAVEPFELSPNGKPLLITMLRTPGGALCELIQPLRKANS
ncbi:MAG: hypothetical protein G8345_18205 [Magnetococcales bacterium]|nr:hypothetical protein [Magnetococcales bacterium]NGZ28809.1 hypothetical protein [Magnetococcales bacterium]